MIQAKRRDRKIAITDIAITKIPYVKIPELDELAAKELYDAHREVLSAAQRLNNSNEVALVYNLYTKERYMVMGDACHVDVDNDIGIRTLQKKSYAGDLVLVYNYPTTAKFSLADIDYFIANDYIGMMTVVTNQGDVYLIRKTACYCYERAKELELILIKQYSLEEQALIVERFLKECAKGGIVYAEGR